MSIFEKLKNFNKKNIFSKTQEYISIEPKEKSVDVDLEKEAYLEELVVKGENIYNL